MAIQHGNGLLRRTGPKLPVMRVIVADDAVLFREGLARVLTDAGFEVTTVG